MQSQQVKTLCGSYCCFNAVKRLYLVVPQKEVAGSGSKTSASFWYAPLLGASCLRTLAALCAVWKADVIVEVAASFAMPRPTIACHVALRQAGVIELVPSSG